MNLNKSNVGIFFKVTIVLCISLPSNGNEHQEGAIKAMNLQTLALHPLTAQWLLVICGFNRLSEDTISVVEMKDCPCSRIGHETYAHAYIYVCILTYMYIYIYINTFSHSVTMPFQSNTLLKTDETNTGKIRYWQFLENGVRQLDSWKFKQQDIECLEPLSTLGVSEMRCSCT